MIKNILTLKAEERFLDYALEDHGDELLTYSKSPAFLLEDGEEHVLYTLYGRKEVIEYVMRVAYSYGA